MPHTLALTDGTTTVNLLGTSAYLVEGGWSPAVAPRRRSELGNQGDYENVVEEITVNLTGASALTTLRQINLLLDQGRRWYLGDSSATPVRLQARPDNSVTGVTLEAPVYGTPDGAPIELPRSFNDYLKTQEVNEVTLRFVRGGLWFNPSPETQTTASFAPSSVSSVTFSNNIPTSSPVDLAIVPVSSVSSNTSVVATILYAPSTSDLTMHETFTSSTGSWSSVAAAGDAKSGAVWRGTFAAANTEYITVSTPTIPTTSSRVFAYMLAMANTADVTLRVVARDSGDYHDIWQSSTYTLKTIGGFGTPTLIALGVIPTNGFSSIRLKIYAQSASTSASVDIDYLVFQADKGSATGAIEINGGLGPLGNASSQNNVITILNNPALYTTPYVIRHQATNQFTVPTLQPLSYNGDAYIQSRGTTFAIMPFVKRSSFWSLVSINVTASVRRYASYLTLE